MADRGEAGRWHRAVPCDVLAPGTIVRVQAGDRAVLVARLDTGEGVAFDPTCPHQNTPLEDASFWDGNIRCPRHQYLYDPRTGENLVPSRGARPESLWKLKPGYLPTYPVKEEDGWVWVAEECNPPPEAYDPALEEPPARTGRATDEREEPEEPEEQGPRTTTKTVRVRAGGHFELRLPTNPLPGHIWVVEVAGALVEVVEQGLLREDPPRWRVRLAARAAGSEEVTCSFRQPWATEPSEVRRYLVEVIAPSGG